MVAQQGLGTGGATLLPLPVIGDQDIPFSLEVGWPVGNAMTGDERVQAGVIPAGSYATAIHQGHPDRLDVSLSTLASWVIEQGLMPAIHTKPAPVAWQGRYAFYLTNPEEQPDPDQWQIEISYLLDDSAPGSDLPTAIGKPATRALAHIGVFRLHDLTGYREADILRRHGIGPKAMRILREALAARGQSFTSDAN